MQSVLRQKPYSLDEFARCIPWAAGFKSVLIATGDGGGGYRDVEDGVDSGAVTNPHFLSSKNNELRGPKSGASIPLNVLGGHHWSNAVGVERNLLRKIIRAEVGGL